MRYVPPHTKYVATLLFKFVTSCTPDRCLVDLLWCPSASQSLASQISSLSIHEWRSMAAITVMCSCHSSCCPWCATCQEISSSFNKTAHLHTGHVALCDFLSSRHPLSFLQICGHWIAPTSIRSITRYGVTSSSECTNHSCTALTNWRSVGWTFGTAWTRVLLTMQLTCGVSILEHVVQAKSGTFRAAVVNLTIALSAEPYDKTYFVSSNTTFVICRRSEL